MQNKLKEQLTKTSISGSNSKIGKISQQDLINAIQEEEPVVNKEIKKQMTNKNTNTKKKTSKKKKTNKGKKKKTSKKSKKK